MAITTGKFKDFFKFGWTDPKEVLGQKELDKACKDIAAMQDDKADALNYANAVRQKAMIAQMKYSDLYDQMARAKAAMGAAYALDPNKIPLPALKMTDLEGPAGKATLEELCDLWRARWSNNWVQRKDITDEFYMVCAQRLVSANRVEAHELADGTHVYRLIERT